MEFDKRSYESEKDASVDLSGLGQRNRRHKFSLYKCAFCGSWHITTVTKRTLRPNRKDKYPIEIPAKAQPQNKRKYKRK